MQIIKRLEELSKWRKRHDHVCFVLTMGALHDGHLSLVQEAKKYDGPIIVSIFVNPTQFSEGEDLDTYPKTLVADIEKLQGLDVDALWLPSVTDIYPNGPEIDVRLGGITKVLEGAHRPHFYDGVATVVKRLFDHVKPSNAFLGEKDFQQLQVIRLLVKNYAMPINIVGVPTMRDENGLALSSRNIYLSDAEMEIAAQLNVILKQFAAREINGTESHEALIKAGFDKIDYIAACNSIDFEVENADRALVAVWLGRTRLIDNMPMAA